MVRRALARASALAGPLVALALACTGDDAATSTSVDATSSAGSSCAPTPDDVVLQRACPLAQVCPVTLRYGGALGCGGPLGLGKPYSSDERCVLTALAAGAPARVIVEEVCAGGRDRLTLDLLGDGTAILVHESATTCACACAAGELAWGPLDRCTLIDLAGFTACLEATTPADRVACMTPEQWFLGCEAAEPLCSPSP